MPAIRHRMLLLPVLALAGTAGLPGQNLYQQSSAAAAVIADLRASAVGDILTITINEAHSVSNEDKVERTNRTSLAARLESFTLSDSTFKTNVLPKFEARKEQSFDGEAKQDQESAVRASVAVIVVDVQPNGNLVVAGTRTVQVDDSTKTLRISGIVRPHDVSQANTISSLLVADARVAIIGDGANNRQVTRGPMGVLFDTLLWAAWPF